MENQIRSLAIGQGQGTTRYHCPACHPERNNRHDKPLSVTLEDARLIWICHHCGYKGACDQDEPRYRPPQTLRPVHVPVPSPEDEPAFNYLRSRGITRHIAQEAGVVYDVAHWMNGKAQRALGFLYSDQGDGVADAVKWRGIDEKAFSQTNAAKTLWQLSRIPTGAPLVICEGEIDTLSMWQAAIPAVSVPNGAPQQVAEGRSHPTEDKKYSYLSQAFDALKATNRVILATDNDTQGEALGEELARRLGRGKCWKVLWPEGCKDANDVLRSLGAVALRECVEQAQPWPVKGLYDALHFTERLDALYDKGLVRGQSTGFGEVDEIYTIMPGQLCVVTGIPSMGKSSFVDQVMVNLAKREGWKFAVCSFENEPSIHIAKLMQLYSGKPFFDGPTPRMTKDHKRHAMAWVNDHFSFLYQGDGNQSSIDDILERLKAAVLRYGVRGAVIDPVNFIDRDKDMTETDWVSEVLTKVKVFIMAYDVHLWFVAHPFKLRRNDDGKYTVPGGYEISGSSHWFNKADVGMTIHRPDFLTNQSDIHIWKCRYNWIGKPGKAGLMYDPPTGQYNEYRTLWQPDDNDPILGKPPKEGLN